MKKNYKLSNRSIHFLINSLAGGGAEAVLVRLLPYLRVKDVFLLERDVKYPVDKNKLNFLSNHTLKTNPIYKTLYIPLYARKLASKINKGDIAISFLERANFVNIFSKLFKKHRAIVSVHTNQIEEHKGLKSFNKFLAKFLYPKADLIIAVSYGVKRSLTQLGIPEEKIKVIYNPFPIDEIQRKVKEPLEGIFLNSFYLITVGRLTKQKGQWHLLRIFRELKKKFSDLKLLILGEGELKDYLFNLSQDLGLKTFVWDKDKLSDNFDVYFLGFQKNPFKYIAKAKVFIFPSLWEGFGNTLVESIACKVPVVSADCRSGPREILAPDTGFKHQTDKPEFAKYGILMPSFEAKFKKDNEPMEEKEKIWVETLEKLLKDEKLMENYAKIAFGRAKDFEIGKIVNKWKEILLNIKQ